MPHIPADLHLRAGGTSVIIHIAEDTVPQVLYWGPDLGILSEQDLKEFAAAQVPTLVSGTADIAPILSLVPSQSEGWLGTPGLVGSRAGRSQFSAFRPQSVDVTAIGDGGTGASGTGGDGVGGSGGDVVVGKNGTRADIHCYDDEAGLVLSIRLELTGSGVLRARASVTNDAQDGYALESLFLALPTPAAETQVLDQTGRHLRERDIQTHEFTIGEHTRTTRIARGHAESTIHGTCEPGAGWQDGLVHYIHVAWSGNTKTIAERDILGFQGLLGGEMLYPGEITLDHGESYTGPWVVGTWGNGLDAAAGRIHDYLRGLPSHPRSVRPVTLNAWEAVYFDHSLERLLPLVDAAADIGVERFVLDDGWFGSRRDDTSGLGDWVVSADVWPDGLHPLADAVHARGMQFGLWVEPEMINMDSETARAHPEWVLSPVSHLPREARQQQVIDLTNPEAFEHVLGQLLTVLDEHHIDYLKWDFNRDLYEAESQVTGLPAYHQQTLATYALMDAILAVHPSLEIESCAGGGGRIDLEMMTRTVRVWASDCIDPLERKLIEAGTSLLLPPELVGSHVASTTSHTTGRTLGLSLRASTALFSHMGIEWDLTQASAQDREELAAWVALHKELRGLLHSGRVVHADHPDDGWWVHGVVAQDGTDAVYALTRMQSSAVRPSVPLRLPGLVGGVGTVGGAGGFAGAGGGVGGAGADGTRYWVRELLPEGVASATSGTGDEQQVPWWTDGLTLPSSVLTGAGFRFPDLKPEQTILLRVSAV
ncbi:MAG: alpha-galactosidase [Ancrocorticia sp.]